MAKIVLILILVCHLGLIESLRCPICLSGPCNSISSNDCNECPNGPCSRGTIGGKKLSLLKLVKFVS